MDVERVSRIPLVRFIRNGADRIFFKVRFGKMARIRSSRDGLVIPVYPTAALIPRNRQPASTVHQGNHTCGGLTADDEKIQEPERQTDGQRRLRYFDKTLSKAFPKDYDAKVHNERGVAGVTKATRPTPTCLAITVGG